MKKGKASYSAEFVASVRALAFHFSTNLEDVQRSYKMLRFESTSSEHLNLKQSSWLLTIQALRTPLQPIWTCAKTDSLVGDGMLQRGKPAPRQLKQSKTRYWQSCYKYATHFWNVMCDSNEIALESGWNETLPLLACVLCYPAFFLCFLRGMV